MAIPAPARAMYYEVDSLPEAIVNMSRVEGDQYKAQLRASTEWFERRHHNNIEDAFAQRYRYDFVPDGPGESVPKFFAMVRATLHDPERYRDFEREGW